MAELWGGNITQQNISYTCQKLGITRKKTYGYQERNELEREAFREKLAQVATQRRVYLDEAGFDNRENYPYGYSPEGERCYALKCGKKRERSSWISALKEGTIFAPLTFEGSCNRDLFEAWLSQSLIPKLNSGDIIILDNATFHKGETIRKIVEEAECPKGYRFAYELWYLPAYSPDLNKIENWWSALKTRMKQMLPEFKTVRECVDTTFKNCPNVFA
jgi:transposase